MLAEYARHFPATIVRFAALFSDWCEYPPLFMFLETWLSGAWNARLLGGRGRSAIPYLHVDDLVLFFLALLDRLRRARPGRGAAGEPRRRVSHQQLFDEATLLGRGRRARAIHMPRSLCGPGMWALDLAGRLIGSRPFERPWMARYIDSDDDDRRQPHPDAARLAAARAAARSAAAAVPAREQADGPDRVEPGATAPR